VDWLPLVVLVPLQPPLAVQPLASLAVQVSVALSPSLIWVAELARLTLGAVGVSTVTLAVANALPPGPEQSRRNVELLESGPTVRVPETDRVPLQPPLAVHDVALLDDQVTWTASPASTWLGLALKVTSGRRLTVALAVAEPPAPLQVRVKVPGADRGPTDWLPDVAFEPDQPPEASHWSAFVDDQASVVVPPLLMTVSATLSETVGSGAGIAATLTEVVDVPPAPVQLSENVVSALMGPLDADPETGRLPTHPPDAAQLFA